MFYFEVAGLLLLGLIILIALNIHTDNWRNRRIEQRRQLDERRGGTGRRMRNNREFLAKASDRRRGLDRRMGPLTRRRKRRRAEDRFSFA